MYYKLGADVAKDLIAQGSLKWADFGATRPLGRKAVIFFALAVIFSTMLYGLGPRTAFESTQKIYDGTIGTYVHEKNS